MRATQVLMFVLLIASCGCHRSTSEVGPDDAGYFAARSWQESRDLQGFLWLRDHATEPGRSTSAVVRELLGDPLTITPIEAGGELWLYVEADEAEGRKEPCSAVFDATGILQRWVAETAE